MLLAAVAERLTLLGRVHLGEVDLQCLCGSVHADGYGDSAELSEELLALITSGRKRAGTGLLWAYQYDGEHIAQAGDIEIVVDHLMMATMQSRR